MGAELPSAELFQTMCTPACLCAVDEEGKQGEWRRCRCGDVHHMLLPPHTCPWLAAMKLWCQVVRLVWHMCCWPGYTPGPGVGCPQHGTHHLMTPP